MENRYDPFGMYAYMAQRPQAPQQQGVQNALAQQILGQPTQSVNQGMGQMIAGLGMGLANYRGAFPDAPGGQKPSLGTSLTNLFTFGHNGGLY